MTRPFSPVLFCDYRAVRFRATAVRSCGSRLIRIVGSGLCPSPGWTLALVPVNGGVVPHPDSLWLAVRETPPDDAVLRADTVTQVEAIVEDSAATEIVIQLPGREPLAVAVAEPAPDQAAAGELIRG
ncbi:hypothetical protein [Agromyces soli]|uniref:Uncharacterized protein n=1 Tax=Agromyces soli TaxID=659012 RepID=A0ABY4AXX1_9MICO|nr:hypothetical protein [Agromyces soli]UOE27689.1 hypothetical protein MTP13_07900 [Agromyces soli]